MIEIRHTGLDGVLEILPEKFGDNRGFFSETYNSRHLAEAGIDLVFVQDNHSLSAQKGVLRGLHYQLPPKAQDKLVRVSRGSILDVAVDIRGGSPTFGQWIAVELSAKKWNQLLVPKGFAHGFVTLEDDTEIIYKVTELYSPEHDRTIRYDDPEIGVEWAQQADNIQLSAKDRAGCKLADAETFGFH